MTIPPPGKGRANRRFQWTEGPRRFVDWSTWGKEPHITDLALVSRRQEAGRRYALAVAELEASLVELGALDGITAARPADHVLATFGANPPDALPELRHREFCASAPGKLAAKVLRRRDEILNEASRP
ncbi:MAG: hypothetical protein K2X07_02805 [Caulobacteraceae bacterium]|nr:hypothetical protein [Caulobacteraceae bacterium]